MCNSDVLVDVCHSIKFSKPASTIDVILCVWSVYVCVCVCIMHANMCMCFVPLSICVCIHMHYNPYMCFYMQTRKLACVMCVKLAIQRNM